MKTKLLKPFLIATFLMAIWHFTTTPVLDLVSIAGFTQFISDVFFGQLFLHAIAFFICSVIYFIKKKFNFKVYNYIIIILGGLFIIGGLINGKDSTSKKVHRPPPPSSFNNSKLHTKLTPVKGNDGKVIMYQSMNQEDFSISIYSSNKSYLYSLKASIDFPGKVWLKKYDAKILLIKTTDDPFVNNVYNPETGVQQGYSILNYGTNYIRYNVVNLEHKAILTLRFKNIGGSLDWKKPNTDTWIPLTKEMD